MKLTTIERTAKSCWSPVQFQLKGNVQTSTADESVNLCPLLATGTVSGAFDESFSSNSNLELFALNLVEVNSESGKDGIVELGKVASNTRFNSIAWSTFGSTTPENPYGIIACGKEDGSLELYNPHSIISGSSDSVVAKQAHSGPLYALDFNPSQPHLLASGGPNGEIFVWDMNNPEKPYSPGPKSPRLEEITSLAWNSQVPHILASSSSNGYTVVWDLKNRKELVHLTSPTRKRVSGIAWNPEVPTQLLTASDDDNVPAIYMWDLKNAHAPEKVLTGHSKGVMSVSWSKRDSDLLLSCGKDNRTLCWNPTTEEIVGEFQVNSNWAFDVQWCPTNPDLLMTASFDGSVSVCTIQAKSQPTKRVPTPSDPFSAAEKPFTLSQPPKWLRTPVGASFGFGSQLVTFKSAKSGEHASNLVKSRLIVSSPEIVDYAQKLNATIASKDFSEVCQSHARDASGDEYESSVWNFMEYINQDDARKKIMEFLGFKKEELNQEIADLSLKDSVDKLDFETDTREKPDGTTAAQLFGQGDDADSNWDAQFNAIGNQPRVALEDDIMNSLVGTPFKFYESSDMDNPDAQIVRALCSGEFGKAVDVCLSNDRLDDALILSVQGGPELLEKTRQEFYKRKRDTKSYLRISADLMTANMDDIINNADVVYRWKEALAILCTFAPQEDFQKLAASLGDRIRDEADIVKDANKKAELQNAVVLSYMVAGRLDKLVGIWIDQYQEKMGPIAQKYDSMGVNPKGSREYALALSSLIEKITIYRSIVSTEPLDDPVYKAQMKALNREYLLYASLLTAQGQLQSALGFLDAADGSAVVASEIPLSPMTSNVNDEVAEYKYRIFHALPSKDTGKTGEPAPFNVSNIGSTRNETASARLSPTKQSVKQVQSYSLPDKSSVPSYTDAYQNGSTMPNYSSSGYQGPAVATPPQQQGYYNQPANQSYNQQSAAGNQGSYGIIQQGYNNFSSNYQPQQKPLIPQPTPFSPNNPGQSVGGAATTSGTGSVPQPERTTSGWNDPGVEMIPKKPKKSTSLTPIPPPNAFSGVQNLPAAPSAASGPPVGSYGVKNAPPMVGGQPQVPAQSFASPVSSQAAEPQGHPIGDRTHIPDAHKPIYEKLSLLLNSCKPNAGPPQRKNLSEAERRLNMLFDRLNNEKIGDGAISLLLELTKATDARDWQSALGIQNKLMTEYGSSEGTNWILGLKRLLDLAKQLA